jgi:cell division protein FtsX
MTDITPEEATRDAVHKTKNAQAAIELAREVQIEKAVKETALQTKEALLEGLREVFGESDSDNPQQMKVLVKRIPILCTNVTEMHSALKETREDVSDMKDHIKWAVRIIVGAFLLAVLNLIIGS